MRFSMHHLPECSISKRCVANVGCNSIQDRTPLVVTPPEGTLRLELIQKVNQVCMEPRNKLIVEALGTYFPDIRSQTMKEQLASSIYLIGIDAGVDQGSEVFISSSTGSSIMKCRVACLVKSGNLVFGIEL